MYAFVLCVVCMANKLHLFVFQGECIDYFFRCYFNDMVGTIFFFLYLSVVRSFLNFKFVFRLMHIVGMTLFCGVLWEYVTPLYRNDTVSDPWDMIAYLSGALCFWFLFDGKALMNDGRDFQRVG